MDQVPIVDHRQYRTGTDAEREAYIHTLGEGLSRFGFANVVGHGVRPELVERAYDLAEEVFSLSPDVLARYECPETDRQRGYTPYLVEKAKDQALPDLKHFWHVGRDLPPNHPLGASGVMPPNVFPDEVPDFEPTMRALFEALEGFAVDLLHAIAAYLGHPVMRFHELTVEGNSVLRAIHYPDAEGAVPGAVRAAAHEDINLLTVLPAATRPGLELLDRDGQWKSVAPPPGAMVCDTGDMMAFLTGGRLPATTHRVVNPPEVDGGRLSMPFFLHPHPDAMLKPFGADGPEIRAHDLLLERLRANAVAM